MPLNYTQRNITSGSQSPMVPLITNNPAFAVKIVPLDGKMEQKPNQKNDANPEKIRVGDTIRGEIMSRTRKRGENVIGRVLQIELEDNAVVAFKVITQRGKDVQLDPSTVIKLDTHKEGPKGSPDTNAAFESHIMLYEEWKASNGLKRDI